MRQNIAVLSLLTAFMPVNIFASGGNNMETTVVPADSSKVVDLDEVVIVAQPKEVSGLRSMPVSSSVFTGHELRQLGVTDLSGLSDYVPSFCMPAYGSRLTSSMYIRGIGSRSGSPAVGVYYDGMPLMSKSAFNSHFYQIDRVDVLRGPQGTLYGMNSEGGLVRIYSKNPLNYQGTDLRLGIGTGLYSNVEVAHYHRPSARLAFSTAGYYSGQRGFFRNTNLGDRADLMNEAGGRARIIWLPADRLRLDVTADYQYTNQNGFAYGEYDMDGNSFSDPSTTFTNGYKRQMLNTGVNLSYDLGRFVFTSVSSYQHLTDLMLMDQDYLPQDYMRLEQRERMNALVQEITVKTKYSGCWQHTSGLFFSYQWLHTDGPVFFGDAMNSRIIGSMGMPPAVAQSLTMSDNNVPGSFETPLLDFGAYHETNVGITDRFTMTLGLRYDYQRVSIDYDTQAQFTLGYDGVMPGGQQIKTSHVFASVMRSGTGHNYHQLLPKVGLSYKLNDNGGTVYAALSKGFRAGGYNLQMFSDVFQTEQRALGSKMAQLMSKDVTLTHTDEEYGCINNTISYEPETSWNYETGAHLNLLGGRIHADLSAFYMRISNQQLSVMAGNYGYGRMMVNAGRSASYGIEAALRGSACGGALSWAATYSYVHSAFRSYVDSVNVVSDNGETKTMARDYRGNRVPFVPRHMFSGTADYRFGLGNSGVLRSVTAGLNVKGNGDIYWDNDNIYRQKLYAVLGAHIALDFGKVRVDVWGRNLTDTKYSTFLINSSADGAKRSFAQRSNPIQIGADLSISL